MTEIQICHKQWYLVIFLVHAGDIKRNTEIGTIDSWGPTFSVSFDLIIHSFVKGKGKQGWTSVLAFKSRCCNHGGKVPDIALSKNGDLRFSNSVNGNKNYQFIFNVDLNRWYNITIEQKQHDQKVTKKGKVRGIKSAFPKCHRFILP